MYPTLQYQLYAEKMAPPGASSLTLSIRSKQSGFWIPELEPLDDTMVAQERSLLEGTMGRTPQLPAEPVPWGNTL